MQSRHFEAHATGLFLATILFALGTGCSEGAWASPERTDSSTSAVLSLPRRESFTPGARDKLTGYRLAVRSTGGACTAPPPVDQVNRWTTSDITVKIRQGCDYSMGVELGDIDSTAKSLKETYFTNIDDHGLGKLLHAASFAGMSTITVKMVLGITEAGRRAGFEGSGVETPEPNDATTDVSVEVSVDASPARNPDAPRDAGSPVEAGPPVDAKPPVEAGPPRDAGSGAAEGGGAAGLDCTRDVVPPTAPDYTCAQQAEWDKCKEDWMAEYCNIACGRCGDR